MDVQISPSLTIPAAELRWRFSRASGPGGQHVNTTDTRVELSWNIETSQVLPTRERERLIARLGTRVTAGSITVSASQHRSQLRNRQVAMDKLAATISSALTPAPAARRRTRPTRGSVRRRLEGKRRRGEIKKLRQRPPRHD